MGVLSAFNPAAAQQIAAGMNAYLAGLPEGTEILHLEVSRPLDALWAMEEGLRCPSLGAVIGEIWGDPAVLDFTATKRLALRAEAHRVPAWIIRRAATAGDRKSVV